MLDTLWGRLFLPSSPMLVAVPLVLKASPQFELAAIAPAQHGNVAHLRPAHPIDATRIVAPFAHGQLADMLGTEGTAPATITRKP